MFYSPPPPYLVLCLIPKSLPARLTMVGFKFEVNTVDVNLRKGKRRGKKV